MSAASPITPFAKRPKEVVYLTTINKQHKSISRTDGDAKEELNDAVWDLLCDRPHYFRDAHNDDDRTRAVKVFEDLATKKGHRVEDMADAIGCKAPNLSTYMNNKGEREIDGAKFMWWLNEVIASHADGAVRKVQKDAVKSNLGRQMKEAAAVQEESSESEIEESNDSKDEEEDDASVDELTKELAKVQLGISNLPEEARIELRNLLRRINGRKQFDPTAKDRSFDQPKKK